MTRPTSARSFGDRGRLYGAVLLTLWTLLVMGTAAGWLVPWIRIIHIGIMVVLIAGWVRALTRGMDAVDLASVMALVAFGLSAVTSIVPRLSAESFFAAIALAAFFGVARRMRQDLRLVATQALLLVMIVLSVVFLILWAATWIEWTRATGLAPSLEIGLASAPFGQHHNVATIIALLAPAALLHWGAGSWRRITLAGLLLVGLTLIFMSGGRAVWLGVGAATMAGLGGAGLLIPATRWVGRHPAVLLFAVVALAAFILVSGLGQSLVSRVLTTSSLDMRGAIWGSALAVWADQPATGWGPGVFTFGLHASDYFDQSVFAPKHADNLYLQTLAELGILGSLGLVVLALAILRSWRRRPPPAPAVWALVFTAVAGIGANPAALGYCAILIVFWAGISAPWSPAPRRRMPGWIGAAAPALVVIVAAVPIVTTTAAGITFDRARELADQGSLLAATEALDEAVWLDPTFSLYVRERGVMRLRTGQAAAAVSDLERATRLNPLDDTTFRALALANIEAGRVDEALDAARTATELQGTDATNQAVLALAADVAGASAERDAALARLLTIAPWSAAGDAWGTLFPGVDAAGSLQDAAALVGSLPLADTVDQRWTLALAGAAQATDPAAYSAAQRAFAHLVACRPEEALRIVGESTSADRVDSNFAFTRAVVLPLNGEQADPVAPPADPLAGPALGDPVGDQARYARRSPQPWEAIRLPSNNGGRLAWLDDPERALRLTRGAPCP